MDIKNNILTNGFIVISNIFSLDEINIFKNEVNNYVKNNKTIRNASGITIPDFIKYPEFSNTKNIINNEKINNVLEEIFNSKNYRFCGHNDIGINRIVGWHKDKLNGDYAKYETIDIWSKHNNDEHEIVKVLIYLQDHSNNNDGLKLVPKSHLVRNVDSKNYVQLKPKLGDIIIFDQRITHRGMDKQCNDQRILVSFGFGKNNIFTDNFEKGTILRQNKQNNI
jgi:ectoine hydroxylase-related dioxygenase (phytanoyl-CoA dioxygenase family)